jgi:hypothetical protein
MNWKVALLKPCSFAVFLLLLSSSLLAQTTAFTYQGKLTDSGPTPPATYQMQFRLYDALSNGNQIGGAIDIGTVAVSDGVFAVTLDFGANVFTGGGRFLDIGVRRNAGEQYTTLTPRQQIASSPYSIRPLSAQQADVALDAQKLNGIDANQYLTTSQANTAFIRAGSAPQAAGFNITGDALIGGSMGIGKPLGSGMRIDAKGPIRTTDNQSTHVIAETTGGTNSWARYYMRTPAQSWFLGSSNNFNSNEFHLVDETNPAGVGRIRMSVLPADGPILFPVGRVGIGTSSSDAKLAVVASTNSAGNNTMELSAPAVGPNVSHIHYGTTGDWYIRSANAAGKVILQDFFGTVGIGTATPGANAKLTVGGNIIQDSGSYGVPKAMLFVRADGTIQRCFNGMTGEKLIDITATTACGFSVNVFSNNYTVTIGVSTETHFVSATPSGYPPKAFHSTMSGNTAFLTAVDANYNSVPTDFFMIVY